ncbi:MAG: glycoside hydrolase family 127 protein [Bacteroidia bacterium]|nr:glycoside hydrolase family 127 protein [Bacteroidia bacterium]
MKIMLSKALLFTILFSSPFILSTNAQKGGLLETKKSPYIKLRNVNIEDVKWNSGFWGDRMGQCEKTMIPYMKEIYMDRALKNFKIAAGIEQGEFWGSWWHDGDFYKWMEALVMSYADTRDKETGRQLDELISILARAQDKDGYIHTAIQIGHGIMISGFTNEQKFNGKKRWASLQDHEVYNLGHLFTLAAIHYRVTGKTNLLNVAIKAADNLYAVFKTPTPELASLIFNPPQIMGLIELYRSTGNKNYLQLAKTFIDMKGTGNWKGMESQDNIPVHEVTEAVGHAVTGTYLYCGIADVYAETGDTILLNVLQRLWEDVTFKKMYITGAVGSYHKLTIGKENVHEAFGVAYDLPNATAYCETCANIGNAMWNWRLLGITGDSKYTDIMEQVFYNSMLSTIGLEGKSYFYTNVLRWYGKDHVLLSQDAYQRWNLPRGGICCPPNTVRTIAEMSNYVYSLSDKGVWVNLYGNNTLKTLLSDGTPVQFIQETNYPWDGAVKITCEQSAKKEFSVMLRIPGWAEDVTLKVNGTAVSRQPSSGSYFELSRKWVKGDVLELNISMPVQLIEANPLVKENTNKIAVKRGPLVYCLESQDIEENVSLKDIIIPGDIDFKPMYKKDLLGGVTVLQGKAWKNVAETNWSSALYKIMKVPKPKEVNIQLIPYYAWNNRGVGEMAVWLPAAR